MKPRIVLPLSRFADYRLSTRCDVRRKPSRQSGTAVIVVLIIIAILMIYVAGNVRTLNHLGRELKLLDQKQRQRLDNLSRTNGFAAVR